MKTLGQIAFEAYTAERGGKNHDGTSTPPWDKIGEPVRQGWEAAAVAAIDFDATAQGMRERNERLRKALEAAGVSPAMVEAIEKGERGDRRSAYGFTGAEKLELSDRIGEAIHQAREQGRSVKAVHVSREGPLGTCDHIMTQDAMRPLTPVPGDAWAQVVPEGVDFLLVFED